MATAYARLMSSLISITNQEQGILVTPSTINFTSNVLNISAHGKINLSVRYNEPDQLNIIESKIVKLLPKYKNLIDSYISIGNKRPVMSRTSHVDTLWKTFKTIANNLDIRLREEHRWSSSDICFVPDENHKIDGVGPIGTRDENKQEYILKYSLIERSALLAVAIHHLGTQK